MQESIFDLFGSHHSVLKQHNPKQTTSGSSFHPLAVTSNLKQKSLSVGGSTAPKRALGDVGNRLQCPRPGLGKEESRKPSSFSCEQKSPSLLAASNKSPLQKPSISNHSAVKVTAPVLKKDGVSQLSLQDTAKSVPTVEWMSKPEIFPDTDVTETVDEYEDLFPIKERLTEDDVYRVVTCFGKIEKQKQILMPPDVILPLQFPYLVEENIQCLDIDILADVPDEQVSLPDLLWDIEDIKEDPLRHTL